MTVTKSEQGIPNDFDQGFLINGDAARGTLPPLAFAAICSNRAVLDGFQILFPSTSTHVNKNKLPA